MIIYAKDYSPLEKNRLRIVKLYRHNVLIRPSSENVSHTKVAIGLGIIEVAGIDPQKQVITLNANFELKWCDDLLRWNTTEQPCLGRRNRSEIFFSADEVWTPDIVAINGPGKSIVDFKYKYPILVICTGSVRWTYQDKLVSFCEIDVRNFPFDRQYCTILLQSSIYDSSQLTLRTLYKVVRLYNLINTEWEIIHATIEEIDLFNPHHESNFSTIKINIELVRHSRFYILKIILPFSILSSLALFSFCLPTDSGEKIELIVSVLLSLVIYLQMLSDVVPKTERGFSLLTLYSNVIFSFVSLSCMCNILTVFIYYREQYSLRNKNPQRHRQPPVLSTIHKSLVKFNKQRWAFLKKRRANISKQTDAKSFQFLHDIRYIRQALMSLSLRQNTTDFHYDLFYSKRSNKQLSVLIDRILFFLYLISMPFSIVILFQSNNQSLSSSTNQLLDLHKATTDPMPLYRDCPR